MTDGEGCSLDEYAASLERLLEEKRKLHARVQARAPPSIAATLRARVPSPVLLGWPLYTWRATLCVIPAPRDRVVVACRRASTHSRRSSPTKRLSPRASSSCPSTDEGTGQSTEPSAPRRAHAPHRRRCRATARRRWHLRQCQPAVGPTRRRPRARPALHFADATVHARRPPAVDASGLRAPWAREPSPTPDPA